MAGSRGTLWVMLSPPAWPGAGVLPPPSPGTAEGTEEVTRMEQGTPVDRLLLVP